MQLIVIAHRGEAQEFIKNLHLKADDSLPGLYANSEVALVISGEGIFEVFTKLPFIFAKHNITKVLNYGIAGALTNILEIGQIVSIRTVYGFNETRPKFHSYTSDSKNAKYDCITTDERVLSDDFAKQINPFAHIVDRELWAIAKCCGQYKIPFESYKLISDFAGSETACFDIKEMALEYSESLFEEYLTLTECLSLETVDIPTPIAMSFSNKAKYKKIMTALCAREDQSFEQILAELDIEEIKTLDIKPKTKASILIEKLDTRLNPLRNKINKQLNVHFKIFTDIGAKVKIDPKLETQKFTISIDVNTQKNLTNLKTAIESFEFEKIQKLWNGELDV